jgi:hypothetical protein
LHFMSHWDQMQSRQWKGTSFLRSTSVRITLWIDSYKHVTHLCHTLDCYTNIQLIQHSVDDHSHHRVHSLFPFPGSSEDWYPEAVLSLSLEAQKRHRALNTWAPPQSHYQLLPFLGAQSQNIDDFIYHLCQDLRIKGESWDDCP